MNAKRYEIQGKGRTITLTISEWVKGGKHRLYLEMTGGYNQFGYYDMISDKFVGTTKEWEKIERLVPEMADQIKNAVNNYKGESL